MRFLTPARAHPNTRALTHTHTHTQRARDERGGERGRERERGRKTAEKTLFFRILSCAYSMSARLLSPDDISAAATRSLPCGTPLVAHARPGFTWGFRDERKRCYPSIIFFSSRRNDAPVPLGFQLSWKLRLGDGHVTRRGQSLGTVASRLTFLLMNLRRVQGPSRSSYKWLSRVFIFLK